MMPLRGDLFLTLFRQEPITGLDVGHDVRRGCNASDESIVIGKRRAHVIDEARDTGGAEAASDRELKAEAGIILLLSPRPKLLVSLFASF